MFETVQVSKNESVTRVHPEANVESYVYNTTSLKPMVQLGCSCGFLGLASVPQDFGTHGVEAYCPNCGSEITIPDPDVLPTTVVKFRDGSTQTMVGQKPSAPVSQEMQQPATMDAVQKAIDSKFDTIIKMLSPQQPATPQTATSGEATSNKKVGN